jgi:hypothetical protein
VFCCEVCFRVLLGLVEGAEACFTAAMAIRARSFEETCEERHVSRWSGLLEQHVAYLPRHSKG